MSIQRLRAKDGPLGINNHELIHARINIVEEFHRRVVFGSLFSRHHIGYNKRCEQPAQQAAEETCRCESYKPF